jgi:hypothetical protein
VAEKTGEIAEEKEMEGWKEIENRKWKDDTMSQEKQDVAAPFTDKGFLADFCI